MFIEEKNKKLISQIADLLVLREDLFKRMREVSQHLAYVGTINTKPAEILVQHQKSLSEKIAHVDNKIQLLESQINYEKL